MLVRVCVCQTESQSGGLLIWEFRVIFLRFPINENSRTLFFILILLYLVCKCSTLNKRVLSFQKNERSCVPHLISLSIDLWPEGRQGGRKEGGYELCSGAGTEWYVSGECLHEETGLQEVDWI